MKSTIIRLKTPPIAIQYLGVFLWGLSSYWRIFHSYEDVTISGEGLQIATAWLALLILVLVSLSQSPVVATLIPRYVYTRASSDVLLLISTGFSVAVAQSVRTVAPHAEGWLFETQPRQTEVGKIGCVSHCKMLGNRCECHGSSKMTIIMDVPCHSRCGTLKNPHCSMAMCAG